MQGELPVEAATIEDDSLTKKALESGNDGRLGVRRGDRRRFVPRATLAETSTRRLLPDLRAERAMWQRNGR